MFGLEISDDVVDVCAEAVELKTMPSSAANVIFVRITVSILGSLEITSLHEPGSTQNIEGAFFGRLWPLFPAW